MQAPKELILSVLRDFSRRIERNGLPTRRQEVQGTAADSGKHALSVVEGAVGSLATKGRGVWGEGAPGSKGGWDLQAWLVVQSGPKLDFRSVFF